MLHRVPQVLTYKNVLSYSPLLMTCLRSGKELAFGNPMEVEIRGLSIYAVDLISNIITSMMTSSEGESVPASGARMTTDPHRSNDCHQEEEEENGSTGRSQAINSILIDFYLWDLRRQKSSEIESAGIPFHKTRCIFY